MSHTRKSLEREFMSTDRLYRKIPKGYIQSGEIQTIAFSNSPQPGSDGRRGMSTEWSHLCKKPLEIRNRPNKGDKPASHFGVVALNVAAVRSIPKQVIEHTPTATIKAHTDVFGPKTEEEGLAEGLEEDIATGIRLRYLVIADVLCWPEGI